MEGRMAGRRNVRGCLEEEKVGDDLCNRVQHSRLGIAAGILDQQDRNENLEKLNAGSNLVVRDSASAGQKVSSGGTVAEART